MLGWIQQDIRGKAMQSSLIATSIIFITLLLLVACSDENSLSKKEAAKILKDVLDKEEITHTIKFGNVKGKKYATKKTENNVWNDNETNEAVIKLAELDSVEITDVTAPFVAVGKTYSRVKYISKYKPTLLGEVFKDKVKLNRKGYIFFVLDGGEWKNSRLKNRYVSY